MNWILDVHWESKTCLMCREKSHIFDGQKCGYVNRESCNRGRNWGFSNNVLFVNTIPSQQDLGGKESETGKEGKPYKVKAIHAGRSVLGSAWQWARRSRSPDWPYGESVPPGKAAEDGMFCLFTSWLLFSISQSWTNGQVASQPFQVATFRPFGTFLESQIPHPAVQHFIQSGRDRRGYTAQPSEWLVSTRHQYHSDSAAEAEAEPEAEGPGDSTEELKLFRVHLLWLSKLLSLSTLVNF